MEGPFRPDAKKTFTEKVPNEWGAKKALMISDL